MLAHLMNETASGTRTTRVPNGSGGWVTQEVSIGTLPCRVSEHSLRSREDALARTQVGPQQGGTQITGFIYFLPGSDVQRNDTWTARGTKYRVILVSSPSPHDVYLRAEVMEYQVEGGS